MYDILLNEAKKVSDVNHKALEFLDSDYNEKDVYQVGKMILENTKEIIY